MSRYTHNPSEFEEWRKEQQAEFLRRTPRRRPQNPNLLHRDLPGDQSTEFSFGPGPVAPHLNGRPPSEGGVYRGRAPRVDPPPSGVGTPRVRRRPPAEVRGDPGERVAR